MALALEKYYDKADYYALPEDIRAELIDGTLIYNQAAPSRIHQQILSELHLAIGSYIKSKGGPCKIFPAPFAVTLDEEKDTVVEPDISVICNPDKLTDHGCSGAPDWIIEIVSPSNSSHDYVLKLNLYLNAGVREYWIVDPLRKSILVYNLEQDNFKVESFTFNDRIKAGIYDDLYIDFASLDF